MNCEDSQALLPGCKMSKWEQRARWRKEVLRPIQSSWQYFYKPTEFAKVLYYNVPKIGRPAHVCMCACIFPIDINPANGDRYGERGFFFMLIIAIYLKSYFYQPLHSSPICLLLLSILPFPDNQDKKATHACEVKSNIFNQKNHRFFYSSPEILYVYVISLSLSLSLFPLPKNVKISKYLTSYL